MNNSILDFILCKVLGAGVGNLQVVSPLRLFECIIYFIKKYLKVVPLHRPFIKFLLNVAELQGRKNYWEPRSPRYMTKSTKLNHFDIN